MTSAGKFLEELNTDLIIYTDASNDGWGATLNDKVARGTWSLVERSRHISTSWSCWPLFIR